jgi:hypothetical protein
MTNIHALLPLPLLLRFAGSIVLLWILCGACGDDAVPLESREHVKASDDAGDAADEQRGATGRDGGPGSVVDEPDSGRSQRTDAGDDSEAPDAGPLLALSDVAIARLGARCQYDRERACSGHNSRDKLVCRDGRWNASGVACDGDFVCDTALGPTQGTCQAIAPLCVRRNPGDAVCEGSERKRCDADLLRYEDDACPGHALCTQATRGICACEPDYADDGRGGCAPVDDCEGDPCGDGASACTDGVLTYSCTCRSGYTGTGTTRCVDIDECATVHGGCDALASCTNNPGAAPGCGACPAGYVGTGASTGSCTPTLTGLALAPGALSPAFDAEVVSYQARVSLATSRIELIPSAPVGATIEIDGEVVASGERWQSPTLHLGDNALAITVEQNGQPTRGYSLNVRRGSPDVYVKASNTGAEDSFGGAIALSGDTLVVSASVEDGRSRGVNGSQLDGVTDSGAVYVFVRDGNTWKQQAYLKASNADPHDHFGTDVAIAGDTLVVSAAWESSASRVINGDQANNDAHDSGAAYVFVRNNGVWTQQAYLKANNAGADDYFGDGVAIAGDTIVVGAPGENSAAAGVNGDGSDESKDSSGAAYVFVRGGGTWTQQAYLKASNPGFIDSFGFSVAISGDSIVVGAFGESSAATGVGGNQADDSAQSAGAAYVFVRNGSTWSQQAYLKASNTDMADYFGSAVAIARDTIAVTATDEDSDATGVNGDQSDNSAEYAGAVYVFVRSGSIWNQQAYLKASNASPLDFFGSGLALSDDVLAIGALNEDSAATGIDGDQNDESLRDSGAVYYFVRDHGEWTQQFYLKPTQPEADDRFGVTVALSDTTLAVGADGEDGSATGIDGPRTDNGFPLSGAVYCY